MLCGVVLHTFSARFGESHTAHPPTANGQPLNFTNVRCLEI